MSKLAFSNTDPEDFEDTLELVEQSYDIQFTNGEMIYAQTFGELCDHIIAKIKQQEESGCTTQQSFYKLREGIRSVLNDPQKTIEPGTQLELLIQRKSRRKKIHALEKFLGFKLYLLKPKVWISWILFMGFIFAIGAFWIRWEYGTIGLTAMAACSALAHQTGKEFRVGTIGELTKQITQEHYLKCRRLPGTINKTEVFDHLRGLFADKNYIDIEKITRETILPNRKFH